MAAKRRQPLGFCATPATLRGAIVALRRATETALETICDEHFRLRANSGSIRRMSTKHDSELDAFERDWRGVLENYEQCRKAYQAALDADAASKRAAARSYWHAIALILHCYNRPANWDGATRLNGSGGWSAPHFAFPPALAKALGNQAMYLHSGDVPAMFTDVKGKGRTVPGPHESRDMAVAVAFVASVRAGETSGITAPIKFTAEAYGISVRTLQKWINEMTWVSKDDFGAPEKLRVQFETSAKNYRAAGRSASAVVARGTKRTKY